MSPLGNPKCQSREMPAGDIPLMQGNLRITSDHFASVDTTSH